MPKALSQSGGIVTSVLTIIAGLILLITAAIYTHQILYLHNLWEQIYSLSIFSIVIGALTVLFACALIFAINRQYPAFITLFSVLLILVAFLAVICGVILITGRTDLEEESHNNTELLFHNYSDSSTILSSPILLARVQQSFKCCGVDGPDDWKIQYPDGTSTPDSCCIKITLNCGQGSLGKQGQIYSSGCAQSIYKNMQNRYEVLIGMNFTVLLLALLSAIFGIVYERYVRAEYQLM